MIALYLPPHPLNSPNSYVRVRPSAQTNNVFAGRSQVSTSTRGHRRLISEATTVKWQQCVWLFDRSRVSSVR